MTKRSPYNPFLISSEPYIDPRFAKPHPGNVDPAVRDFVDRDLELPSVPMKLGELAFKGGMEAAVAVVLTADKLRGAVGRAIGGRQQ